MRCFFVWDWLIFLLCALFLLHSSVHSTAVPSPTGWCPATPPMSCTPLRYSAVIVDGFYLGAGGTECPPGNLIPDAETCRVAHDALGISRSDEWTGTSGGIPAACGSRPTMFPNLHWNSATNGQPRSDVKPVCKGVCCGGPRKRIGGHRSRDLPPQHPSNAGFGVCTTIGEEERVGSGGTVLYPRGPVVCLCVGGGGGRALL